ncbi:MAG: hypothetical protein KHZ63_10405 [Actinomyces sp.]|nr:hypothetical protein [Actinomyces sp.]
MTGNEETVNRYGANRIRIDMVECADVVADRACPPHDLPAVPAGVAVAVEHCTLQLRIAIFARASTLSHDFLAAADVDEFLISEKLELAFAFHLDPPD